MCGHITESILEVNLTDSGILNDTWRILVVSPNCSIFPITFCILSSLTVSPETIHSMT